MGFECLKEKNYIQSNTEHCWVGGGRGRGDVLTTTCQERRRASGRYRRPAPDRRRVSPFPFYSRGLRFPPSTPITEFYLPSCFDLHLFLQKWLSLSCTEFCPISVIRSAQGFCREANRKRRIIFLSLSLSFPEPPASR